MPHWVNAQANSATVLRIEDIVVTGHKKTKTNTILRELDISKEDTIHLSNLGNRLATNQILLMNTGLFSSVKLNVKDWNTQDNRIRISVDVAEFWFIYPFPVFELSDRNFNEWWQTYNHSLQRVNIGLRFYHINLTGRGDLLKLVTQFGFTNKYELEYRRPNVNKAQTLGLFTNLLYTRNKEIAYNVVNDTLQFFRDENDILLRRIRGGFGLDYRPNLFTKYGLRLNYHHNFINERVLSDLNPNYFNEGVRQRYFSLSFFINWDKRDIRPFPLKGHQVIFSIEKYGFGVFDEFNAGNASLTLKKYHRLHKKWSLELIGKGQIGLVRAKQPFYRYRGLGYLNDFIRGYELYVINGLDYVYSKTSLRFELFNFTFQWGKIMPIKQFRTMPIRWYLSFNHDIGYVHDPFFSENNSLRNTLLWSGGLGLNMVVFYDKVIQIEYSRNKLGESGIFLHWELNF